MEIVLETAINLVCFIGFSCLIFRLVFRSSELFQYLVTFSFTTHKNNVTLFQTFLTRYYPD